jgi:hypothetical protein
MRELQSLAKRTIVSVANDEEGRSRQASIETLRSDSNVRKDIGCGDHGGVDVGYPWFRKCAIRSVGEAVVLSFLLHAQCRKFVRLSGKDSACMFRSVKRKELRIQSQSFLRRSFPCGTVLLLCHIDWIWYGAKFIRRITAKHPAFQVAISNESPCFPFCLIVCLS